MHQQPSKLKAVAAAIGAAFPPGDERPRLFTVDQFAARNPAFTSPALRNLIFKAAPRRSSRGEIPGNGLAESGAIVRLGRRVLIDERKFLEWASRSGKAAFASEFEVRDAD